jgi:Flp pilus assembly pilin Flp
MFDRTPIGPAIGYLRVSLAARYAEARARDDKELGASVVEWVVITTIVVVIAVTAGYFISQALTAKTTQITSCINTSNAPTQNCGGG